MACSVSSQSRSASLPSPPRSPFILGIAGGSGSGKSTLAAAVAECLPCSCLVLEHDRYYRDLSALPPAARAQVNFDDPAALDNELLVEHLRALQAGCFIDIPQYDFATHTRLPETTPGGPAEVIVVVGVLLLVEDRVRRILDASVFVDAPGPVRFIRRLERDVRERGRTVESVVRQYLHTVRPAHESLVGPSRRQATRAVSGLHLTDALAATLALIPADLASAF